MTTNAIPNGPCAKPPFVYLEKSVMMEFIYLCSETLVQSPLISEGNYFAASGLKERR